MKVKRSESRTAVNIFRIYKNALMQAALHRLRRLWPWRICRSPKDSKWR